MKFQKSSLIIFSATAILCGAAWLHAEVRLIDPEYNFGLIKEVDGVAHGKARLVNDGPDTIEITSVRPSCGCTAADYTKGPILPGDTAEVTFSYNPLQRPGEISKSVKVYVSPGKQRYVIFLTGRVLGSSQTLARNYPIEAGPMRLSEKILEARDVKPNTGRHAFLRVVNQSMDTITPTWNFPDTVVSIQMTPKRLAPGEIGSIGLYFNSRFEPRRGNIEYQIPFSTLEDSTSTIVTLRANILPGESTSTSEPTEE